MGAKSRENWSIKYCIKAYKCKNKDNKCNICIKYLKFEEDSEKIQT